MSPTFTEALVLATSSKPRNSCYHDIRLERKPIPQLKEDEVLVRMSAVAFNHRELWLRKGLFPESTLGSILGSDGAGTVIASSKPNDPLINKRVFLVPTRGWESCPVGPETKLVILGGGTDLRLGTFAEYVTVDRGQVIETPEYLSDEHAAAWPIAGVTSWRVVTVQAQVQRGHNILITGIGGGVALTALQLCVALGANVYVTSGDEIKIAKAIDLGAKAGVNYKIEKWPEQLAALLNETGRPFLDAVIDSAGGDITKQTNKMLKPGGRIVVYGMTAAIQTPLTMREVLKNIELRGSTAGSHRELREATAFISKHRIFPIISHVLDGLDKAEIGFELLAKGNQHGKIVMLVKQRARL